jgi:hypothetical protein
MLQPDAGQQLTARMVTDRHSSVPDNLARNLKGYLLHFFLFCTYWMGSTWRGRAARQLVQRNIRVCGWVSTAPRGRLTLLLPTCISPKTRHYTLFLYIGINIHRTGGEVLPCDDTRQAPLVTTATISLFFLPKQTSDAHSRKSRQAPFFFDGEWVSREYESSYQTSRAHVCQIRRSISLFFKRIQRIIHVREITAKRYFNVLLASMMLWSGG